MVHRILIALKILRKDLHPLEDQLEYILHKNENHWQLFTWYHIYHWYQWVNIEIKFTSDELSHLNRVTKVLKFLFDSFLDLLLHLLLVESMIEYRSLTNLWCVRLILKFSLKAVFFYPVYPSVCLLNGPILWAFFLIHCIDLVSSKSSLPHHIYLTSPQSEPWFDFWRRRHRQFGRHTSGWLYLWHQCMCRGNSASRGHNFWLERIC